MTHRIGSRVLDEELSAWIDEQGARPAGEPWGNLLDGRLDGLRQVVQPDS